MQFDRIKYMDTKGAKGLSAYSELAEAALKMYHTDREGFELLAKKCWEKYGADWTITPESERLPDKVNDCLELNDYSGKKGPKRAPKAKNAATEERSVAAFGV